MSTNNKHVSSSPVARSTPYDNLSSGLTSTDVQGAIDELANGGGNGASPGYTFGRSGNSGSNTWLLNETVPSNKTGRRVSLSNAEIAEIFASNENINTYTIGVYSHDGNEINLTLLDTLTVTSSRGNNKSTAISIASNKQLAIKVTSGSATNIVAGIILRGTTA